MSSLIVPIVTIKKLDPIEGADRIELANFWEIGWQVIVQKGHKVGDLLVYVPPESVLPEAMVTKYGLNFVKNGRVRSIKLKGVYSHGLTLPVPDDVHPVPHKNMAEYFGITKYEEVVHAGNNASSMGGNAAKWPDGDLKYTDIENGLNFPAVLADREIVVTEKVHGMNFQAGWVEKEKLSWWEKLLAEFRPEFAYEFRVFSRNKSYTLDVDNAWTRIAKKYNLPTQMKGFYGLIVCGEIYGKGVQDLTYGLNDVRLMVFDFQKYGKFFDWRFVEQYAYYFDLIPVPVLYEGIYDEEIIKALVNNTTVVGMDETQISEGVVIRPAQEGYHPKVGRLIVKLINPAYLTRKGGTEFH